jgi:hypothetical protein
VSAVEVGVDGTRRAAQGLGKTSGCVCAVGVEGDPGPGRWFALVNRTLCIATSIPDRWCGTRPGPLGRLHIQARLHPPRGATARSGAPRPRGALLPSRGRNPRGRAAPSTRHFPRSDRGDGQVPGVVGSSRVRVPGNEFNGSI